MLETIVSSVRADLPDLLARAEEIQADAAAAPAVRDFRGSLMGEGLSVIAEIKRRSPSRGMINAELDPIAQGGSYDRGGAAAISVLTERRHFDGSPADLVAVRSEVRCPVLRKDFVVHELQVAEARAMGADAVLLIVAILEDAVLTRLVDAVRGFGMTPLVEVHDEGEVARALAAGADVLGVNNRDLSTFEVDLATAERLAPRTAEARVRVAESGIWDRNDAVRMFESGYDAVLVGEALVRAADPAELLTTLRVLP